MAVSKNQEVEFIKPQQDNTRLSFYTHNNINCIIYVTILKLKRYHAIHNMQLMLHGSLFPRKENNEMDAAQ